MIKNRHRVTAWAALVAALGFGGCAGLPLTPQAATRPVVIENPSLFADISVVIHVACSVDVNGRTSNCTIADDKGLIAFDEPALEYARSLYYPLAQNGQPVAAPHYVFAIGFWTNEYVSASVPAQAIPPGPIAYPPGVPRTEGGEVLMSCTIGIDGATHDCAVVRTTAPFPLTEAALTAANGAHYQPAWRDGHPIAEVHHPIFVTFTPDYAFPAVSPALKGIVLRYPAGRNTLYPSDMIDRGIEGEVVVTCDIDVAGHTHNCQVTALHGDRAFADAALAASVQTSVYALRDGNPVAVSQHPLQYNFRLDHDRW